ncbi:MAG: hypothetical protein RL172_497 [Bacteroidota bacterium]|jgi:hypothetical protein
MKLWYVSLILSIVSCMILLVVCFLPDTYTVFNWSKADVQAGILFPVLLISWTAALFGFLFNNIFIDRSMMDKNAKPMPAFKSYLPSFLGLPAFASFVWFIIRWYKGKPNI